jgi:hypothetical protein
MKHVFFTIVLLAVAGLAAACGGNTTGQPAAAAIEPAALAEPAAILPTAIPTQAAPATTAPQTDNTAPPAENQAEPVVAEAPPANESQPVILALEPQSNNENAVTVEITPLNLPGGRPTLDFEVVFNTHSVELDFDPAAITVLRDDQGREYPAIGWDGAGPGGHHRSGTLQFKPLESLPKFIEVVMQNVAGVPERVFHWDLAQS